MRKKSPPGFPQHIFKGGTTVWVSVWFPEWHGIYPWFFSHLYGKIWSNLPLSFCPLLNWGLLFPSRVDTIYKGFIVHGRKQKVILCENGEKDGGVFIHLNNIEPDESISLKQGRRLSICKDTKTCLKSLAVVLVILYLFLRLSLGNCKYTVCTIEQRIFSTRYHTTCTIYSGCCAISEIEHSSSACTVDNPLA